MRKPTDPAALVSLTDNSLPAEAFERIRRELKLWADALLETSDPDAAFRYEMFSRRLVAAEYGRVDAVIWARDWYCSLVSEDLANERDQMARATAGQEARAQSRREIEQGKSGNPHFQAYLDTLESPGKELYFGDTFQGWKYLVWIGPLIGKFDRRKDLPDDPVQRAESWKEFLRVNTLSQRAKRLGGPVTNSDEPSP